MGKSQKAEEEEVYQVEVITKARVALASNSEDDEDGSKAPKRRRRRKSKTKAKSSARWEYYVKWADYDSDSNSWEPEENVAMCQRLLASFWEHVGTDNADYDVGYEVAADEKWIKREKKFFAREFSDRQKELRVQRERDERERRKKSQKKKKTVNDPLLSAGSNKVSQSYSPVVHDHDSGEENSLKKRKLVEETSSDDEIPLIRLPLRKKTKTSSLPSINTNLGSYDSEQHLRSTDPLFSDTEVPVKNFTQLPPHPPKPQPSSAKSTPTIPPKIPHRLSNPHAGIPKALPDSLASGSGLSTKQRLSQGALAPTRPKAVPLPIPKQDHQPPSVKISSSSLMNLSFKKRPSMPVLSVDDSFNTGDSPSPITPSISGAREPTLASLNAPLSPVTPHTHMPQSGPPPEHYVMHDPGPTSPKLSFVTEAPQRPAQSPIILDPSISSAERFLQSIMPPVLAAPLIPTVEVAFEPQPPAPLVPRKLPLPRMQKKWSWSGGAFIEANPSPIFNVTLFDATEPARGGLRFGVALATMKQLDLAGFHDAVDIDCVLRACKGVHQFARLGPKDSEDVEPLQVFSTYMTKMKKMISLPISLDNTVVAHIIIFHHSTAPTTHRLRPPFELQRAGSLVAALVPWALTSAQLLKHYRKPPRMYLPANTEMEPLFADMVRWNQTIRINSVYQHALRVLQFPPWLHKYMSEEGRDRTFWVWCEGGDGTKKKPGMETKMLQAIMEQCRAKKPRNNLADSRVIFVHTGAVKTLHRLSGFLEFCSVSFHVQFYTYGTHQSVPPMYWGVREIYPCGGIVTFTPNAVLDDPIGTLHRISQIHSHPLWECYILPSALGMAAKLHCRKESQDPLTMFDSGVFPYVGLLNAIENGELALITSPPEYELSPTTNSSNNRQEWLRSYWTNRPQGPRHILESAVNAFNLKYGNIQETDWAYFMHDSISKDLASMRCQPVFMEQYRRYIVIESHKENCTVLQDGLEWTTHNKFDFKDEFFIKQE